MSFTAFSDGKNKKKKNSNIKILFLEEFQTNISMFSYSEIPFHEISLKPKKTLVDSVGWAQIMTIAEPVKDRLLANIEGLGIAVGGNRGTGSILAKKNAFYLLDLEGEEEVAQEEEEQEEVVAEAPQEEEQQQAEEEEEKQEVEQQEENEEMIE